DPLLAAAVRGGMVRRRRPSRARARTGAAGRVGGGLEQRAAMIPTPPLAAFVHDNFRALVLNDHFTCLGAKSAIRHNGYRFALYDELGGRSSVEELAADLASFAADGAESSGAFTMFVASFVEPAALTEPV